MRTPVSSTQFDDDSSPSDVGEALELPGGQVVFGHPLDGRPFLLLIDYETLDLLRHSRLKYYDEGPYDIRVTWQMALLRDPISGLIYYVHKEC